MSRSLLIVAACACAAGLLRADDPPKTPDPGPPEFEAKFADDSTLKVLILDPAFTVTTKYGKVTVPVADVKRIALGFRFPPGVEDKIDAAAADLGAVSFRAREEAEKALVEFGEYAVPAVRRARKSDDPEAAKRAESVWKKLSDKLPSEKLEARDYDLVEAEFPIRGRIDPAAFRIKSRYFGDAELRLAEVRAMRSMAAPNAPAGIELDAAKYARQGWAAWLDTGVDVAAGEPLEVAITGQIDQWPQQPGQYISGPQGTGNAAPGLPNGQPIMFPQQVPGVPVPNRGFTPSGSVIGKIGPTGQPFLIGASYRQPRAPGTGRLQLIIAPSNWGNDSSGTYLVKVKAGSE